MYEAITIIEVLMAAVSDLQARVRALEGLAESDGWEVP